MTCAHTCGCTREAEPGKPDCFRCFAADRAGRPCGNNLPEQILLALGAAEKPVHIDALCARFALSQMILAPTLLRMLEAGSVARSGALTWCLAADAEAVRATQDAEDDARRAMPLRYLGDGLSRVLYADARKAGEGL